MNLLKKVSAEFMDCIISTNEMLNVRGGTWNGVSKKHSVQYHKNFVDLGDLPPDVCIDLLNSQELIDLKIAVANGESLEKFYNMDMGIDPEEDFVVFEEV